jgi:hypothetical protein
VRPIRGSAFTSEPHDEATAQSTIRHAPSASTRYQLVKASSMRRTPPAPSAKSVPRSYKEVERAVAHLHGMLELLRQRA